MNMSEEPRTTKNRPAWLANWLERHQNQASFWLHMIGIPLTIAACVLAIVQLTQDRWDLWWRPVLLVIAGYFLQWLGHRIEGNELGEVVLIKRLLGRPYIAIAPRYEKKNGDIGPPGSTIHRQKQPRP